MIENFMFWMFGTLAGYVFSRKMFRNNKKGSSDNRNLENFFDGIRNQVNNTIKQPGEDEIFTEEEHEKFREIWIDEHVNDNYGVSKKLDDDKYIRYHLWENKYSNKMYEEELPDTMVISGKHEHIIFHGGCLSCTSQQTYGVNRCKGCEYFKADWQKPNLRIEE